MHTYLKFFFRKKVFYKFISKIFSYDAHDIIEYLVPFVIGFTPCGYKKLLGQIINLPDCDSTLTESFDVVGSENSNSPPS